jgi:D-serine deaminase-like pyridoxal phosphate-dependent protein
MQTAMDYSLENHASYIGRPASELPTPALVLSKPVLEHNTRILLEDVKKLGIGFRPHVKTLKVCVTSMLVIGSFLIDCHSALRSLA